MTWVFNRSGESLPVAMLVHTSVNTFLSLALVQMFPMLPSQETSTVLLLVSTAAALVLLAATHGRLGYRPNSSPAAQSRPAGPRFPEIVEHGGDAPVHGVGRREGRAWRRCCGCACGQRLR